MSFFLKNNADGELLFQQNFSAEDFERQGYGHNTVALSFPFGQTKSEQWVFDGIRMMYNQSDFTEYATFDWQGDTEMITMYFNLTGKFSMIDTHTQKTFELLANQHNIFYGKDAGGKMKVDELKLKSFTVQLSKEAFFKISNGSNNAIKQFADKVAAGIPTSFSDFNLSIDFAIQNCINSILLCPYQDGLKKMFLQSKAIELLVLQADSFNRAQSNTNTVLKTEYDTERILFARDYLLKYIDCPPTLSELSKIAGINEFKLKRGFKETFNQSVFQYLSNTRLESAKILLLAHEKSATELAFELGYSSVQHFSTAFKKKFGVSPNQIK
jgi:AraC family transcriptional regulator, transcriptional activator of the genes for pyochelin and ferripyochelin receptors